MHPLSDYKFTPLPLESACDAYRASLYIRIVIISLISVR
nr:MAG TPA: hypothetical protein [Caudoviricetes sp.]